MSDLSVHMIAQLVILDEARFMQEYVTPVQAINERHGVEVVQFSPSIDVIEGSSYSNMAVILKFRTKEVFSQWYNDEEYQALIEVRQQVTDLEKSSLIVLNA